jgi:dihydropteroate synthase
MNAWSIAGETISLAQPRVMGILNVTPDSFSDGGELPSVADVLRRAERMIEEGAALLDVGGESTRPGASQVDVGEEIRRVVPAVESLVREFGVPISIDTRKADVARGALEAGARIVNDVSALAFDPRMGSVVAEASAGVVLMHMRGTPADMRERAVYADLTGEVRAELAEAVDRARAAGVRPAAIALDPGFGFAKDATQSLRLLGELPKLATLGFPMLVGPSRKSFLGEVLALPPKERAVGTATACVLAYLGGARIFRVHDVAPVVQALAVAAALHADVGSPA